MTPPPRPAPPAAPTSVDRSATAKRAETRTHILTTAIAVIDELGIAGASASEIARRSGLSWGVIQYHFGDRLGLLQATFDLTIDQYVERLASWSFTGTVAARGEALVDQLWAQMATPRYRTSLEIQLHLRRQSPAATAYLDDAERASDASRDVWRRTFPDVDEALVDRAQSFAMPSLRGFAVSRALGADDRSTAPGRATLVEAVVAILRSRRR